MASGVTAATARTPLTTAPVDGETPATKPAASTAEPDKPVKAASLEADQAPATAPKKPAMTDTIIAVWDTERVDAEDLREPLLPDVHVDLETIGGDWSAFPEFLKQLKDRQDASDDHTPVTLVLNVHGNNGTGLKTVHYERTDADGDHPAAIKEHATIASAAQINAWLKEAGFDPDDVTVVYEGCNAGHAYQATVDGFNAHEKAAAITEAKKLAGREHATLAETTFVDVAKPKADLTYRWIGRRSGGNTAGSVFLQAATGMGTGVTGEVAAAPLVDLNKVCKPGKTRIGVTGDKNPWPDAHFDDMLAALRNQAPRLFQAPGPTNE